MKFGMTLTPVPIVILISRAPCKHTLAQACNAVWDCNITNSPATRKRPVADDYKPGAKRDVGKLNAARKCVIHDSGNIIPNSYAI